MTRLDVLKTLTHETGFALCNALHELDKQGVSYFISEGGRTLLTQCLYALQGRLGEIPLSDLEWACKEHGIRPPDKQIITKTLKSNHLGGNAVDIVPLVEIKTKDKDGNEKTEWKPDWNNQDNRIVTAMKNAGFLWGGDWQFIDKPHFELRK
jgi:hypothetical protein